MCNDLAGVFQKHCQNIAETPKCIRVGHKLISTPAGINGFIEDRGTDLNDSNSVVSKAKQTDKSDTMALQDS